MPLQKQLAEMFGKITTNKKQIEYRDRERIQKVGSNKIQRHIQRVVDGQLFKVHKDKHLHHL